MEIKPLLNKIAQMQNLKEKEASFLLEQAISGNLTPSQIGAMLMGLRIKGESVDEILGFIKIMRKYMVKIKSFDALDIVGTGGDGSGTFNISTTCAFVLAGMGIPVAKHGNRAASSKCGSADVLEALGVNISLSPQQAEGILKMIGVVFLFAPVYHPAMKQIGPIRKELGIRTVFNFLGPFLNPAQTKKQLLGVANISLAKKLSLVAKKLNYKHLLIISSEDGMDEITNTGKTHIFDIQGKKIKSYKVSPDSFGIKLATKKQLKGKDAKENAKIILEILKGKKSPKREIVLLNSAAAFYVYGKVKNIKEGINLAAQSIDSGRALKALEDFIKESKKYA